jgi:hypothetical protein
MTGLETAYGFGDIWNVVEAPHHTVITPLGVPTHRL